MSLDGKMKCSGFLFSFFFSLPPRKPPFVTFLPVRNCTDALLSPLFASNYTALWFESKWKRSSRSGAVRRKQRRRLNSNEDEEKKKKRFAASFDHFIFSKCLLWSCVTGCASSLHK